MSTSAPLVFRPTLTQRTVSALFCTGAWIVGARGLVVLGQHLPRILEALRASQALGESTLGLWVILIASIGACVIAGFLLLAAILALLLIESTQVLVDELGIAVLHGALPGRISRWCGSGRLTWKQIGSLEKGHIFFILRGGGEPLSSVREPTLRFLMLEQMDRLVMIILERSPNLRFKD